MGEKPVRASIRSSISLERRPSRRWIVNAVILIANAIAIAACAGLNLPAQRNTEAAGTFVAVAQELGTATADEANRATGTAQASATAAAVRTSTRQAFVEAGQTLQAERLGTVQVIVATTGISSDWHMTDRIGFSSGGGEFFVGNRDSERRTARLSIENGQYLAEFTSNLGFLDMSLLNFTQIETHDDFYIEATGQRLDGPSDSEYGLILRYQEDPDEWRAYVFLVSDAGYYSFVSRRNNNWFNHVYHVSSNAILRDQPNRLGVRAEGTRFVLFINGEVVDEIVDSRLESGQVGLAWQVTRVGVTVRYSFDDFMLFTP